MNKRKKVLTIISLSIVASFAALILLISPIAKYLIQKYDSRFTGREITLDWAYVNPLTGYIYLHNVKIYEYQSDSIFLSTKGLAANFTYHMLLYNTYEISTLKLSKPIGKLSQSGTNFNFDDLIVKFAGDSSQKKSKEPTKFNLLNIEIEDGEFHYIEDQTPINYFIKKVNIKSTGLRYDADSIPIDFSLFSGPSSGKISGNIAIQLQNKGYALQIKVDSFDLDIINQYLKDLTNYGSFAARLDAELETTGNFATADSISTSGVISISDFNFGRTQTEDYASFDRLDIAIARLSPKDFIYHYDSICLLQPYFKYQRFDSLDNIQTMFGQDGDNVKAVDGNPNKFNLVIEIAHLIDNLSRNLLRAHYQIGRVAIYDANLQYEDFTLGEKFSVGLNPFTVLADSIDKSHERVEIAIQSGIKPHGNFNMALSINPRDSSDFDLNFGFQNMALSMINPYMIQYTGFPINRGTLELHGKWHVYHGSISSTNHLILIDPRLSDRIHGEDTRWLPMNLGMAILRENGNVIDYEVPINGELGDPSFNFWDIISDIFNNIVFKPTSTSYRLDVRNLEQKLEKSQRITWKMRSSTIGNEEQEYIAKIIQFLKNDASASIVVSPKNFSVKEKELILLFEAKRRYYLSLPSNQKQELSEQDSQEVARMSIKDPGFLIYLNTQVKDPTLFTVQDKSLRMVGAKRINMLFNLLIKKRELAFKSAFIKANVMQQVQWVNTEYTVPYSGFSYFDINYRGEMPDYLIEAFDKMNKLNSKDPREAYQGKRKRNKGHE